jgi:hypothetical protein
MLTMRFVEPVRRNCTPSLRSHGARRCAIAQNGGRENGRDSVSAETTAAAARRNDGWNALERVLLLDLASEAKPPRASHEILIPDAVA